MAGGWGGEEEGVGGGGGEGEGADGAWDDDDYYDSDEEGACAGEVCEERDGEIGAEGRGKREDRRRTGRAGQGAGQKRREEGSG